MSRWRRRRKVLLAIASVITLAAPGAYLPSTPVAGAAECSGEECQGPAPAPEDPVPGTAVVEGPSNPPVHYPKVRKHPPAKEGKGHKKRRSGRHRGGSR